MYFQTYILNKTKSVASTLQPLTSLMPGLPDASQITTVDAEREIARALETRERGAESRVP